MEELLNPFVKLDPKPNHRDIYEQIHENLELGKLKEIELVLKNNNGSLNHSKNLYRLIRKIIYINKKARTF